MQQEQQATNASGHSPRSYASALSANIPGHNPPSPRRIAPHAPPPEAIPDDPIMIPEGEPTVVLDGQNIGREYGGSNSVFKSRGVQLALDHYARKGMSAVAVLPRNKVDQRPFLRNGMPNTLVADDPGLLLKLQDQQRVFFAPAGTHDDDMIIDYAMTKNAVIVSNDRYNRELERQVTAEDVRRVRSFLDSHLVPFTFHGDEFIPHPDPFQLGRNVHHSRVTGH